MTSTSSAASSAARRTAFCAGLFGVVLAGRLDADDSADDWSDVTISPRQVAEPLLETRLFPDSSRRKPEPVQTGGLFGYNLDKKRPLQIAPDTARRELLKLRPSLAKRIDAMSDDEAIVRYFVRRYQVLSDRHFRALLLPPHQGLPLLRDSIDRLGGEPHEIANTIPAVSGIYVRVWALRRRIAALRIVEALRHHAARHNGRLPASLDQIEETPIPLDPAAGRPFQFRRKASVARLFADDIEIHGRKEHAIRFQVRIRQAD